MSAPNKTYVLSFRDRDVGGPVTRGRLVRAIAADGSETGSEQLNLIDLRREQQVTFVIHGFNVHGADGERALTAVAKLLRQDGVSGALVAVLWPGDSGLGPVYYMCDTKDARDTADRLVEFLDKHEISAPLHFVTHILGARVALEAMRRMLPNRTVGRACLMAAAVDLDCLARAERYREAVEAAKTVAVLASYEDQVLRSIYPLGDLSEYFFFRTPGDRPATALGWLGPHDPNDPADRLHHTQIDPTRKVSHGDYIGLDATNQLKPSSISAVHYAAKIIKGESGATYG